MRTLGMISPKLSHIDQFTLILGIDIVVNYLNLYVIFYKYIYFSSVFQLYIFILSFSSYI